MQGPIVFPFCISIGKHIRTLSKQSDYVADSFRRKQNSLARCISLQSRHGILVPSPKRRHSKRKRINSRTKRGLAIFSYPAVQWPFLKRSTPPKQKHCFVTQRRQ